ncbi:MAG: DNA repair protein RadA [Firmicutes bacterium]|nr:DNA repair protein RadA [Bacillota bacterium]
MAKSKNVYVCTECGYESSKWYGKCPSCGEWNTLEEQIREAVTYSSSPRNNSVSTLSSYEAPIQIKDISTSDEERCSTGMDELNRVLGGGIVKGSLILLGGDPGIGKSTILMQICEYLGRTMKILYVSGEESRRQLKLRAIRLGVNSENLYVMTETDVERVIENIKAMKPDIVMIDSIQTMNLKELSSSPGSVVQVRECTNAIMRTIKALDIPTIIVGHVNKDGAIAGPKVLEHVVDAVLYFEGDRHLSYRILRAVKNRYGSTNEIGVFEMQEDGLCEVENPSMMLLSGRPVNVSGTCVACAMEGTRPIFAEVQGLAASSGFGNPRRMSTGFDINRMNLIIAVLEKRSGYFFANMDTYINIVGGMRLFEPAVDLAVAVALVSSLKDVCVGEDLIAFGEIGLAGELRAVNHAEARIREASRLGFKRCIMPYHNLQSLKNSPKDYGIQLLGVRSVREAIEALSN